MLSTASLDPPGAGRMSAPLGREAIFFAGGNGICLQAERGVFTTYKAVLFDRDLRERTSFKLDGSPSRTRVSADGRVGAITVFLTGQAHGYATPGFSTKTSLLDMASSDQLGELEQFSTWRDGARFQAADFNFWGVTFARDSNVFYATLRTAATTSRATTYLVRGDLGLRKLTVLRENVECPSISPDDRLIAYKKRVGGDLSPWRLYVLDLTTMTERALAGERRSVDDQVEWLDNSRVLYAPRRSSQSAVTDVWVSSVDGDAPARVFLLKPNHLSRFTERNRVVSAFQADRAAVVSAFRRTVIQVSKALAKPGLEQTDSGSVLRRSSPRWPPRLRTAPACRQIPRARTPRTGCRRRRRGRRSRRRQSGARRAAEPARQIVSRAPSRADRSARLRPCQALHRDSRDPIRRACAEIVADRGGHDGRHEVAVQTHERDQQRLRGQRQERRGEKAPAEQRHIRSHRSDSRLP
jgi:hypothetical protein